jgi:hypothetical protein
MKTTIATIMILLLSTQAQAEGFYQQLIGNTPQSMTADNSVDTDFSYSPLYQQVTSHDSRFVSETGSLVKEFSYTPLYLQVKGEEARDVSEIAKRSSTPDEHI